MAKEKEDGDYKFVPPDFDEDAFIHREMVAFRTTSILFLWAIVAALVSWAAFLALKGNPKTAWPAGLAICLGFGLALRPIFQRFADISHFKRSNWIGSGILFFFTWLAFFTVAVNPPITDISPPQVLVSADPPVQAAGGVVDITFLASDNDRLAGPPVLTILRNGQPLEAPPVSASEGGRYSALLAHPLTEPGHYVAEVSAADAKGHSVAGKVHFNITESPMTVYLPPGNNLTGDREVKVTIAGTKPCTASPVPCIRTVYFSPRDGAAVPFEYITATNAWHATARIDAWQPGNQTGPIVADFLDHFKGTLRVDGGKLTSPETYQFNVHPPADRVAVNVPPEPGERPLAVPGYGLLGAVAALAAVAIVLRRRSQPDPQQGP